jgi:hypothetical protein
MNTAIGKITLGTEEFRDTIGQNDSFRYQFTLTVHHHPELYVTFFSDEKMGSLKKKSLPETCEIMKRMKLLIDCGVFGSPGHRFAFHRLPIGHSLEHWSQNLKAQMNPKDFMEHMKAFHTLIESLQKQGIFIKSLNSCLRLEECDIKHGRNMVRFYWNEEKKAVNAFLYPTLSLTLQKEDAHVSIISLQLFLKYWSFIELTTYMGQYTFDSKLRLNLQKGLPFRKSKLFIDTLNGNSLKFWSFTVSHDPSLLIKVSKWKKDFEPLKTWIHPDSTVAIWKKQKRLLDTRTLFDYKIYIVKAK